MVELGREGKGIEVGRRKEEGEGLFELGREGKDAGKKEGKARKIVRKGLEKQKIKRERKVVGRGREE